MTPILFILILIYTISIDNNISCSRSSIKSTIIVQFLFFFMPLAVVNPLYSEPKSGERRWEVVGSRPSR